MCNICKCDICKCEILDIEGLGFIKIFSQCKTRGYMYIVHNHINDKEASCGHSYKDSGSKDARKFMRKLKKDIRQCNDPSWQNQWKVGM